MSTKSTIDRAGLMHLDQEPSQPSFDPTKRISHDAYMMH
jgi:hypothetical protein